MAAQYQYLYAHFPFCEVICHYCDFYTARSKGARQEEFFEALIAEAKAALPHLASPMEAIYLGGGTPSVSPPELLARFLSVFRDRIGPQTEITIEANPANIEQSLLRQWREMGINRISLGIQSLSDPVLKRLGRTHTGQDALAALSLCRAYIPNVSGDLIYGVPGQPEEEPAEHGVRMARAGATHISAYHLTIEPEHFLFKKLPADSFAWAQIEALSRALEPMGFSHYEVSNFSLSGYASKNNSNYWSGGAYWALGPSAHGFDGSRKRWKNVADWEAYVAKIRAGETAVFESEELSLEQRRIETLFTSLRTSRGIDLESFNKTFQQDLLRRNAALFRSLEKEGLATLANGRFALTFAGRMLADEIVRKLL